MNDYLIASFAWSLGGLVLGVVLGYEFRVQIDRLFVQEGDIMTTPQRLKRRQMVEGTSLLVLGIITVLMSVYFRQEADAQRNCLADYIQANNTTSQVRAQLLRQESEATRKVIIAGTSVRSLKQLEAARRAYLRDLRSIDQARLENPIPDFKGCG